MATNFYFQQGVKSEQGNESKDTLTIISLYAISKLANSNSDIPKLVLYSYGLILLGH